MSRPETAYRAIILAIHSRRHDAFAVYDLVKISNVKRASVTRVLTRLAILNLVMRVPGGFNSRYWKITARWPHKNCLEAIEEYETWRVINRR